jgi:hypothetical protein
MKSHCHPARPATPLICRLHDGILVSIIFTMYSELRIWGSDLHAVRNQPATSLGNAVTEEEEAESPADFQVLVPAICGE